MKQFLKFFLQINQKKQKQIDIVSNVKFNSVQVEQNFKKFSRKIITTLETKRNLKFSFSGKDWMRNRYTSKLKNTHL